MHFIPFCCHTWREVTRSLLLLLLLQKHLYSAPQRTEHFTKDKIKKEKQWKHVSFSCRLNIGKGKDCDSHRETGSSFQRLAAAIVKLMSRVHLKDLETISRDGTKITRSHIIMSLYIILCLPGSQCSSLSKSVEDWSCPQAITNCTALFCRRCRRVRSLYLWICLFLSSANTFLQPALTFLKHISSHAEIRSNDDMHLLW